MSTRLDASASAQKSLLATLRQHPSCIAIDRFLRSPWYFLVIGALTLLSSILSLELVIYTCFILIAIFAVLLGTDLLPIAPLIVLSYISPAVANNPGLNDQSVFSGASGIYVLCIAGLFVLCLVFRLCTDPIIGQKAFFSCKRSLLPGMLALGAAYMLGGVFSGSYSENALRNLLFAFVQFASVTLFYYLFTGGIRWSSAPKEYLAWAGLCFGTVILGQLVNIYIINRVIQDGQIIRERIFSGWGNYNNMGTMLAMAIPFVFWLACKRKRLWAYELMALVFLAGVLITCSRGSILTAAAMYVLCYIVLVKKKVLRLPGLLARLAILFGLLLLPAVLLRREIYYFFESLITRGWNPSERDEIYTEGLLQFLRTPIFGGSFYPTDYVPFDFSIQESFSNIFPPRWHNTFVQILASCGIVGFAAYIYHRLQTVKLFLKKPGTGKIFIGLSILTMLSASMVDCHFFNIGPTLFYSAALAFAEKSRR